MKGDGLPKRIENTNKEERKREKRKKKKSERRIDES